MLAQKPNKEHVGGTCQVEKMKAKIIKYSQNQNTVTDRNKMLARKQPRVHSSTFKTK